MGPAAPHIRRLGLITAAVVAAATAAAASAPVAAEPREKDRGGSHGGPPDHAHGSRDVAAGQEPAGRGRGGRNQKETRAAARTASSDPSPADRKPANRSAPQPDQPREEKAGRAAAKKASGRGARAPAGRQPAPRASGATTPPAAARAHVAGTAPGPVTRNGTPAPRDRPTRRSRRSDRRRQPAPTLLSLPQPRPVSRLVTAIPVDREAGREPSRRVARQPASRERPRVTGESPSIVTRTVTRIVQVVPKALRYVLAALAFGSLLLAGGIGLAALRARRSERQRRLMAADVGLLQSALMPVLPPRVGRAAVSAAYRPAGGPAAGGDFYDVFALDENRTCVIVGDVAGHGRDALPLTSSVRHTVRAYLEAGLEPRLALQLAGRVLDPQLDGRLVTVVAALYDAGSGRLTYACAGHPPPVLTGATGAGHEGHASPPLGAGVPTGRRQVTVVLPPGRSVCFYTDGLVDARCGRGRFGAERLRRELAASGSDCSAGELISRIVASTDSLPDDMAAVILRAPAGAAVSAPLRLDEFEPAADEVAAPRTRRFLASRGVQDATAREVIEEGTRLVAAGASPTFVIRTGADAPEASVEPAPALPIAFRRTRFDRRR